MTPSSVVITGGAGGMGLAAAKVIGREHRLVLSDLGQERLDAARSELEHLGISAQTVVADITDRAQIDALLSLAGQSGRVAAVVHTAGVSPQMGRADFVMNINARGTVNVTEAALNVADEGFALVNVASIAGHLFPRIMLPTRAYRLAQSDVERFMRRMNRAANRGPAAGRPALAYAISKNFVTWYSAAMAARFGERGARVLSVSPGSFDTSMGRLEEQSGSAKMLEYSALKRFGTPEEMGELLAFCASERAGYLTGVDILCDGGNKAGVGLKEMVALARNRS